MNSEHVTLAERCMAAAYDGTMSFPAIVRTLAEAGFEGYTVDFRRRAATYYRADGGVAEVPSHDAGPIALALDGARVGAAVRAAQTQAPGYTYAGFCREVAEAGCAGYTVSFLGRRVVYFGRTGDTVVEHFPS